MDQELLDAFSIINSLKQEKDYVLENQENLLKEDILSFKNNGNEKPTLNTLNEKLNEIFIENNNNPISEELKFKLFSLFEDFIRCSVNEINNFDDLINIISNNLLNLQNYIYDTEKKFTFNFNQKINNINRIYANFQQLEKEIEERRQMILKLKSDIL